MRRAPASFTRLRRALSSWTGLVLALLLAACTPVPSARMIGVTGARVTRDTTSVMVLVEIHNPTGETLMLSGLDYEVRAKDWFTARGSYALARLLPPGDRSVIEIPLPVKNFEAVLGAPHAALEGVEYELDGKLRAWRAGGETQWKVTQKGRIAPVAEVGPEARDHRRGTITIKAVVGD